MTGRLPSQIESAAEGAGRRRSPGKARAILEGAKQEFLQRGYAAASMDRIAALAGVSKATIYNHHGDKASLFQALTAAMVKRRVQDVFLADPTASGDHPDPRHQLIALAERILDARKRQPDMLDFLRLVIGESGRFPQLAMGFVAEVEHHALTRLVQTFARISDSPELKARIFVGTLMQSILFEDILHGNPLTDSRKRSLARELVNALVPETLRSGTHLK